MKIGDYEVHPAAAIFPLMGDTELRELALDIKANGLRNPIVLHEGKLLDGRNRMQACLRVDVKPTFAGFKDGSPTAFVLSQNLHRRHLTASQRAMIAAKVKPMYAREAKERQRQNAVAHNTGSPNMVRLPDSGTAREQAAKSVGVSGTYVDRAEYVLKTSPETAARVEAGEITLPAALRKIDPASPPLPKVRDSVPEDKDPETLQLLKAYWKRATKKERAAFCAWAHLRRS